MKEEKRRLLMICLEVVSLGGLLPLFYWGTLRLFLEPICDVFYYTYKIRVLGAFLIVAGFDAVWLVLMWLCPKERIHAKVILTLLVLTFSAAVVSCFVIARALDW